MKNIILLAALLYSAPGHSQGSALAGAEGSYPIPGGVCHVTAFYYLETAMAAEGPNPQFVRAQAVCYHRYGPRSPCLVKFEQIGPNDYHATCGAKR